MLYYGNNFIFFENVTFNISGNKIAVKYLLRTNILNEKLLTN